MEGWTRKYDAYVTTFGCVNLVVAKTSISCEILPNVIMIQNKIYVLFASFVHFIVSATLVLYQPRIVWTVGKEKKNQDFWLSVSNERKKKRTNSDKNDQEGDVRALKTVQKAGIIWNAHFYRSIS